MLSTSDLAVVTSRKGRSFHFTTVQYRLDKHNDTVDPDERLELAEFLVFEATGQLPERVNPEAVFAVKMDRANQTTSHLAPCNTTPFCKLEGNTAQWWGRDLCAPLDASFEAIVDAFHYATQNELSALELVPNLVTWFNEAKDRLDWLESFPSCAVVAVRLADAIAAMSRVGRSLEALWVPVQ